jgi:hypothetical protein
MIPLTPSYKVLALLEQLFSLAMLSTAVLV